MRVLLVSLFHPAISPGGAQQACYNLFKGLQKAKYEPILLASVERHMWPALFKSGATITEFDKHENEFLFLSQGYDHTFHRNKDPRNLDEFEDFLRVIRPNVIHFHCFVTFGLEYFATARRYLDKMVAVLSLLFTIFWQFVKQRHRWCVRLTKLCVSTPRHFVVINASRIILLSISAYGRCGSSITSIMSTRSSRPVNSCARDISTGVFLRSGSW